MQEFATRKAIAQGMDLRQLNCLFKKYRMAVRIMKLTAIILLAACLQLSARGISQTISLSLKDAPLQKVFKEIERQTDYTFFYKWERLEDAKKVTIKVSNLPIDQVLALCFKDQPFTYSISGKTITIASKKDNKAITDTKTSFNQNPLIDVKGRVLNSNGEPVTGATITVQGTKQTTVTNRNGEFSLSGIDEEAVIVITHIQYESASVVINGHSVVNATLKIKISSLDDMQVVAYGTTTKRLNTGNVVSIKSTEIEQQPVNNPLLALQGRVPGMVITQSTGLSGSGVRVQIRGQNSIINGTDPLYIIDGVPYTSQLLPGLTTILGANGATGNNSGAVSGNPLAYINPSDIESIDILKDADATAIYGSRAANGVVLITTKKGKQGKLKVDVNMQTGWGKVTRFSKLLNTQKYLEMRNEAIFNDGSSIDPNTDFDLALWDTTRYTDWQKALIGGTARYNDMQNTISGGSENIQFLFGTGYHKETTVFPGNFNDQAASIHFNITGTSNNKKFQVILSGNYVYDQNKLSQTDLTSIAVTLPPNAPNLYNPDGTLNWAYTNVGALTPTWPSGKNPLAYLKEKFEVETYNLVSRATIAYQIITGLEAKVDVGYTNMQMNQISTNPFSAIAITYWPNSSRSSNFADNNIRSWVIEPQVKYVKKIFKGDLNVLIGGTIQEKNSHGQSINANGFSSDDLIENLGAASTLYGSTVFSQYKYNAIFGRVNYNLYNKYLINLTGRRDGSSRFGPENRFQNFGAIGMGWLFTSEKFVQNNLKFLSYGKLRGSYGTTGNDQIGDYSFTSLYIPINYGRPYQGITGLRATELYNPELEWELTKKLEGGVELGFFQNRVFLAASYYRNRSSNQLLSYKLSNTTGFTSILSNFPATVQNEGVELELSTTNLKTRNFTWKSSFNVTIPKNKLVSFPDLENSSYNQFLFVGEPIGVYTVYKFLGVNDSTGQYQFEGPDGKPTYNPSSPTQYRPVHVNLSPKYYGGFQNSFNWKGFQLDILLQFTKQVGRNFIVGFNPGQALYNQPANVLRRWQQIGDQTTVERFSSNFNLSSSEDYFRSSDASYTDASFIRLKNVSFSWQLPFKWVQKAHLQSFRVYAHGQNMLTITNYQGVDPETQNPYSLPPLKIWTLGIQCAL